MKNKTLFFEERKKELEKRIFLVEKSKKEIINLVQKTLSEYKERKLSLNEYREKLGKLLENKPAEEWLKYNDNYIELCKKHLAFCSRQIKKEKLKSIAKKSILVALSISAILIFIYFLLPAKILLAPPINIYVQDINLSINKSQDYEWKFENPGTLQSLKLSGFLEGNGEVSIYLENKLILNSSKLKANIALSPQDEINNSNFSIAENFTSNISVQENANAAIKEIPSNESNVTEPMENAANITRQENENITPQLSEEQKEFKEICEETCNLSELKLKKELYALKIELIGNITLSLKSITYELMPAQIMLPPSPEPLKKIPKITKSEKTMTGGKRIFISSDAPAENLSVSTEIPETWNIKNESQIKIYWREQGKYINFIIKDKDNNGKIDEIEYISPENNQTYDIIVITKAEHLDANKTFFSDIYEEVKSLNAVWSETIPSEDYIRITFEANLTSNNDITIYPRIISGNPRIKIYEKEKQELIAEFASITSNQYNKIILSNLKQSQDSFDLLVLGGEIEIDHIIDPVQGFLDPTSNSDAPSSVNWANPARAYTSDNSRATGRSTANHNWYNFGFSIPASALIMGIEVRPEWSTSASSAVFRIHAQLLDSSRNPIGLEKITPQYAGTTDRTDILGNAADLWSAAWNPAIINNANFGIRITAERISGGGTATLRLDNVDIRITYKMPPAINDISNIPAQAVTEAGTKNVPFTIQVSDADGYLDIQEVTAEFSKTGEQTRTAACTFSSNINPTTATYNCAIGIQYWDGAGNWAVSAIAVDSSALQSLSYSETFTLLDSACIVISPASLTWDTLLLAETNKYASNNPLTIWNTCNHEGGIQITASNLIGETNPIDMIPADKFKVHTLNSQCTSGTLMSHNAPAIILDAILLRGDNSLNQGKEELYFCIEQVPDPLLPQQYSTSAAGSQPWIIGVLASILAIAGKNKTRKEFLKTILKKLKASYGISLNELLNIAKEIPAKSRDVKIPLMLFRENMGASEALCKYLKENIALKYSEIARLLNRNQKTIWISYRNSMAKKKEEIKINEKSAFIPVNIFSNRKLSILESLISYLRKKGFKNIEIADMLKKDPRNTWTLYSRALKKLKV